jgi:hypothetical protein
MSVQQHDRRPTTAVAYPEGDAVDIDVVEGEAVEEAARPARGRP